MFLEFNTILNSQFFRTLLADLFMLPIFSFIGADVSAVLSSDLAPTYLREAELYLFIFWFRFTLETNNWEPYHEDVNRSQFKDPALFLT